MTTTSQLIALGVGIGSIIAIIISLIYVLWKQFNILEEFETKEWGKY